jgi:hypothetical protein
MSSFVVCARTVVRFLGAFQVLQALDMRPFPVATGGDSGAEPLPAPKAAGGGGQGQVRSDWSGGTVVAGTGSLDLLVDLPPRVR